ncbi:hypothetical protein CP49_32935 [Bradyrhizobium valentinum]|uniref:Uncharacterized protein n=2 Tax=Bradyrhizobium valentinum TaxID=1518501 RepID=A0A0R3KTY3_9BRAD|nr:hypothetical protein CP49_32935 [Bradyrhizobium valentinum]
MKRLEDFDVLVIDHRGGRRPGSSLCYTLRMDKLDRLARAAAAEDEQNFHTCEGEPPPGCANDDTDVRKEAHQGVKDSHQGVKDFLQTPLTSPLNKSLQHHETLSGNVQRAKASNNSSTDKIPSKADQKRQQSDQQSFTAEDVAALAQSLGRGNIQLGYGYLMSVPEVTCARWTILFRGEPEGMSTIFKEIGEIAENAPISE